MNAPKHPVPPRAMSPTRAAAAAAAAAAALALALFALVLSPALAGEEKHFRLYSDTEAPGFRFGPRALAAAQFAKSATLTISSNGAGAAIATTNGKPDRTVTVASSGAATAAATGKCGAAWAQCGGNGFAGSTCCTPGHGCAYQSEWYEHPP